LIHKAAHNIGIAIDSPSGLIVPVIKNVQSHSIISIALEIQRLSSLAHQNKLATSDLSGATFTVSNVGSIGGHVVAPVIVSPQIAILGVGKAKAVPAFDAKGNVVRKDEAVFSWSADHRVIDGATVARFAQMVKGYLEEVERMIVRLR
jgi:2-oxoisovalerate dehydrogenase E2 component (dihydrolipoyl transacylase)